MSRTSTFIPTMRASLYKTAGFDRRGRSTMAPPVVLLVAPVRLIQGKSATSIRTDKTGSKSRAEEPKNYSKILVHPRIGDRIDAGDEIEIYAMRYEVQSVEPRFDMSGFLHHYEVEMA